MKVLPGIVRAFDVWPSLKLHTWTAPLRPYRAEFETILRSLESACCPECGRRYTLPPVEVDGERFAQCACSPGVGIRAFTRDGRTMLQ